MAKGKWHDKFNLLLGATLAGVMIGLGINHLLTISFGSGWLISTLILSPDLDFMPKKRSGFLRFVLFPYSLIFKHRGIAHSFWWGTLTRIIYILMVIFLFILVFYRMGDLAYSPQDFGQAVVGYLKNYQYVLLSYYVPTWFFVGMFCADVAHLMLDKISDTFKKILVLMLISFQLSAATPAWFGAASFIPGLGQTFNGNYIEGLAWFTTTISLLSTNDLVLRNIGQDIWFYNMYDAWKDAGGSPSQKNFVGYEYAQNFNPMHLADPFAIGFIGTAAASRSSAGKNKESSEAKNDINKISTASSIALFTFVGFGEESLFRGFMYPAFSSWLGNWGGAMASSALFSFAHVGASSGGNAARFIMGMLFCWQYTRNKYQLGGNIFAHSWYDQVLIGQMWIPPKNNSPFKLSESPIGLTLKWNY